MASSWTAARQLQSSRPYPPADLPGPAARPGTRGGIAGFALIKPKWHGKNTATGSAGTFAGSRHPGLSPNWGFRPNEALAHLDVRRHDHSARDDSP
jgi:hypothetical protein